MAPTQNKALILCSIPSSYPIPGEHLKIENRPIDLSVSIADGALLLKNHYVSFDPFQRGRMRPSTVKSYSPAYTLNEPITNSTVSTVLKSSVKDAKYREGDMVIVFGQGGTSEYTLITDANIIKNAVSKLENPHGVDEKHFIGALGMPGLTAYSSFYEIAKPKKGETIFISAASGAVGQVVGQLAKREGMTVLGSVGDNSKLEFITQELGFDGGFNYKKEKPHEALKRLAPKGIDVYYENVGGVQLEAALTNMRDYGRIVACGMISQYNTPPAEQYGIKNLTLIVQKRLTMRGFVVSDPDMGPKYKEEHTRNLSLWIKEGSVKAKVSVTRGIENAAEGFVGMLKGENFGKAVLEVSPVEREKSGKL